MKKLIVFAFSILLLSSCSHQETFKTESGPVIAEGYGIANEEAKKIPTVVYSISAVNVILAILFCETIVVPIYVVGWELYEPDRLKTDQDKGVH